MKTLIVGGKVSDTPDGKASSIIHKLIAEFDDVNYSNGGGIADLKHLLQSINTLGHELILWFPEIDNTVEKLYPKKTVGTTLICSKVIGRDGRDEVDAVTRIFKMHANAVVAINTEVKPFTFKLIDALGNSWGETSNIAELAFIIKKFYLWSNGQNSRYRTRHKISDRPDYT